MTTLSETTVPPSPVYHSCPSSPISPSSPLPRPTSAASQQRPLQYRIEERRRTIFVSGDNPQTIEEMKKIFSMADISEAFPGEVRNESACGVVESLVVNIEEVSPDSPSEIARASSCTTPTTMCGSKSPVTTLKKRRPLNTPPLSPIQRSATPRTPVRPRILFYHKHAPHYGFTNFSPHPVIYQGRRYPTSEHLFQSFKFQSHRPNLAEHIRLCSEWPSVAFKEARRFQPEVRSDWHEVNIKMMDEALRLKFTQHHDLREELLATGDAELVEDSDKDAFWGVGPDGRGRNELGKALERLRDHLRAL